MDPHQYSEVAGLSTEACEQAFKWLAQFKHIVHPMNDAHFKFYMLRMLELHNRRMMQQKHKKHESKKRKLAKI
jgi:hypothetical protein